MMFQPLSSLLLSLYNLDENSVHVYISRSPRSNFGFEEFIIPSDLNGSNGFFSIGNNSEIFFLMNSKTVRFAWYKCSIDLIHKKKKCSIDLYICWYCTPLSMAPAAEDKLIRRRTDLT